MNGGEGRTAEGRGVLRLEKVRIALGSRLLVALDAAIGPGEVLTLMGPSGSGKSSLLAFIAGFLDPVFAASGSVTLGGTDLLSLPPERRNIGLLFQDALLFPHMSVGGNLAFALRRERARDAATRQRLVEAALVEAGLSGMAERDPATLSGGQQSRVALMRVLLAEPGALLLDEPFSRLDAELRQQIREFVFMEARKRQLPVLMVTHDPSDAEAAGGRVVELGA
ncbi:MAG: ATP-binding cassette domain-containing protein [Nitratireductor sp.]|nr:ATP-binding cassette domain-containing protein [Nitratireductor sp.]